MPVTATRDVDDLVCPHCSAMNRPGVSIITRDDPSTACVVCGVCSYAWRPEDPVVVSATAQDRR